MLGHTTSKITWVKIAPVAGLTAVVGLVLIWSSFAAGTPTAFEAESGTLAGGAAVASITGQSGTGAVKFAAAATPTPTPAGELMGWQLTPTNIGLAPFGLSCDALPAYTGTDNPANGTVITGKRFTQPMYLYNGTITITKSCFKPTSNGPYGPVTTWNPNIPSMKAQGQVTITDSEIDGSLMTAQEVAHTGAYMGVGILMRNYIHDVGSGIAFYNTGDTYTCTAINNYVHKLRAYGDPATTGSHNESFTIRDHVPGASNRQLVARGNYLTADSGNDTGAFFIQPYGGFIDNADVENNLLAGGGYQLILEYNYNLYGTHMKAINNRMTGTGFGPGYVDGGPGWQQATDNYRYDSTKPDGKGAAVNL